MQKIKKAIKIILPLLAVFALLAFAGTSDYTDEVIYNMPADTYEEIKEKLGSDCTAYQIAREYTRNYELYNK